MHYLTTYEEVLDYVFKHGEHKGDRTGTGTRSVPGMTIRYDLRDGFPLITSKQVPFRLIASELLWFISGNSNIRPLLLQNNHIWSEWAYARYLKSAGLAVPHSETDEWKHGMKDYEEDVVDSEEFAAAHGDLGPVYGVQWRHWKKTGGGEVDQIQNLLETITKNPDSRRMVVSAWRPDELADMALEPCHNMFQFIVTGGKLSIVVTQRSCDMFLGVPFNIASYALLTHMVAQLTGLEVGMLTWNGGDVHIYDNHVEQVTEQLARAERPLPRLEMVGAPTSLFGYTIADFKVADYAPHPTIKAPVAV